MKYKPSAKKVFIVFAVFSLLSIGLIETMRFGILNANKAAYEIINTSLPMVQKAFDLSDKESESYSPEMIKQLSDKLAEMSKTYDSGLASSFPIMAYSLIDDESSRKSSFMDSVNNLPDSELPMFLYATKSYWDPKAYKQEVSAMKKHGIKGEIGHTLISLSQDELKMIRDCRDVLPEVGSYETLFKTALHGLDIKFYSCRTLLKL